MPDTETTAPAPETAPVDDRAVYSYLEATSAAIQEAEDDNTHGQLSADETASLDTRPISEQARDKKPEEPFDPYANENNKTGEGEPVEYVSDLNKIDPAIRAKIELAEKWEPLLNQIAEKEPTWTNGQAALDALTAQQSQQDAQSTIADLQATYLQNVAADLNAKIERGEISLEMGEYAYKLHAQVAPDKARAYYNEKQGELRQQQTRVLSDAQAVKARYDLTDKEHVAVQMAMSKGADGDHIGRLLKDSRVEAQTKAATNAAADRAEGKNKPANAPVPRNSPPRQTTVRASDISYGDAMGWGPKL